MNVLDLFSGIGGFSLGLDRAVVPNAPRFKTVAFCESDAYCKRVLARHWPGVPVYGDVRTLGLADLMRDDIPLPDVICGGFPCQDLSLAGKGAGLSGARSGLWFEYLRIIDETRPAWVIIENVPALRSRGLDIVLGGLAALGYDAEWHCIPAVHLGTPHQRDRVWVLAYASSTGRQRFIDHDSPLITKIAPSAQFNHEALRSHGAMAGYLSGLRDDDGLSLTTHRHRLRMLGNSIVPQIAELIGRSILSTFEERRGADR